MTEAILGPTSYHNGYVQLNEDQLKSNASLGENCPPIIETARDMHNQGLWCVLGNTIVADEAYDDPARPYANILPYNARTVVERYRRAGILAYGGPAATNGKNTLCVYTGNSHGIWVPQKAEGFDYDQVSFEPIGINWIYTSLQARRSTAVTHNSEVALPVTEID